MASFVLNLGARSTCMIIFSSESLQTTGKEPPVAAEKGGISAPRSISTLGNKCLV
jgi:hypothetical protein